MEKSGDLTPAMIERSIDELNSMPRLSYRLFPAGLVCRLCDKLIDPAEPWIQIQETKAGLTVESWAHKACVDSAAGKP